MKTKSGKKIENFIFKNGYFAGIVDGKIATWDVTGKRNSKNKSKNDLAFDKVVVIYRTGRRVNSKVVDRSEVNSINNVIKHYEI